MSKFAGYALPGSVFLLFGIKWSVEAALEHPRSNNKLKDEDAENNKTERPRRRKRRNKCFQLKGWPIEGIIKLTITSLGIAGSVIVAYLNGRLQNTGDMLYATVYLFFAISGLVDVLVYYCPQTLPPGIEQVSLALAFLIEGLMFQLHLMHKPFMEQHVHSLLVYIIFLTAIVSLIEIIMPSTLWKLVRGFLTLVHGSWYVQSGFILHSPIESETYWASSTDYNNALVRISLTFAWHCAISFVVLLVFFTIIGRKRNSNLKIPNRILEIEATISLSRCSPCSSEAKIKL